MERVEHTSTLMDLGVSLAARDLGKYLAPGGLIAIVRMAGIGAMQPSTRLASNDRFANPEQPFVVAVLVGWSCPSPVIVRWKR